MEKQLLYRCCTVEEYLSLIKNGELYPNPKRDFISLSKTPEINKTEFGYKKDNVIMVIYDYNLLLKQGAIEIEYTSDFFKSNPYITKHVTGQPNIKALIEFGEITNDMELIEYIEMYAVEQEVIIKKIVLVPNLIINIIPLEGKRLPVVVYQAMQKQKNIEQQIQQIEMRQRIAGSSL